ncbi:MAG: NAD-dependent epimerase/dehydratase family protein [Caulobacteraceae bacterium]
MTGASGFVGSAVARALLARGHAVTCLVRGSSPRTNLDGLPLDIAVGDMTDQASVQAAARGARYLFHVAADYRIWARDPDEIVRTNREGTGAVMRAALAAGVEAHRLHLFGRHPRRRARRRQERPGGREPSPDAADRRGRLQALQGDRRAAGGADGRRAGPARGDRQSLHAHRAARRQAHPHRRIIVEAAQGKTPAFVDTGLNLATSTTCGGHLLALDKGRIGERYILGGQDVTLRRMFADIAALRRAQGADR